MTKKTTDHAEAANSDDWLWPRNALTGLDPSKNAQAVSAGTDAYFAAHEDLDRPRTDEQKKSIRRLRHFTLDCAVRVIDICVALRPHEVEFAMTAIRQARTLADAEASLDEFKALGKTAASWAWSAKTIASVSASNAVMHACMDGCGFGNGFPGYVETILWARKAVVDWANHLQFYPNDGVIDALRNEATETKWQMRRLGDWFAPRCPEPLEIQETESAPSP